MAGKSLQQEPGKMPPFESPEKEAMLDVVRTSDQRQNRLGMRFHRLRFSPLTSHTRIDHVR
jgi:hypothetical protein